MSHAHVADSPFQGQTLDPADLLKRSDKLIARMLCAMAEKREESRKKTEAELGPRTPVPLGVVVSCTVAICGLAIWLHTKLTNIDHSLSDMKRDVNDIRINVKRTDVEILRKRDFNAWVDLLRASNPNINLPPRIE